MSKKRFLIVCEHLLPGQQEIEPVLVECEEQDAERCLQEKIDLLFEQRHVDKFSIWEESAWSVRVRAHVQKAEEAAEREPCPLCGGVSVYDAVANTHAVRHEEYCSHYPARGPVIVPA